jgi:hypothetical protein
MIVTIACNFVFGTNFIYCVHIYEVIVTKLQNLLLLYFTDRILMLVHNGSNFGFENCGNSHVPHTVGLFGNWRNLRTSNHI